MAQTLKASRSPDFFKTTRVNSCQYILSKSGHNIAISFPITKTGYKAPNSWTNQKRSSETLSYSRSTYRIHEKMHLGMGKKPLIPYDPNSYRSRLATVDFIAPYRNASQLEIGDRTQFSAKSIFRTTNQALFTSKNVIEGISNQGIIAEKTKWHKSRSLI